jgi:uroporphyrin-3 C-methyltransferase
MEPTEQQPLKRKNPGVLIASIALLVAILIAGEVGFYEHASDKKLSAIKQNLIALQIKTQQQQFASQQLNNTLIGLQTQFQQQQINLNQLQQLTTGKQSGWLLAEVNYLVQLANYNVRFTRDVPAAIALLQTADQRLTTVDDPALIAIRHQLVKNIADLQAVPKVDLAGVLLRLTTLQQQVTQLPLQLPTAPPETVTSKPEVDKTKPAWRRELAASWHSLRQLVIIRRVEQPITPLPSVMQQAYLQQNLQLLLQQARAAVLRDQTDIYQANLQQAKDWIQRYFVHDAALTQAVVQSLTDLQKMNVAPALPDLDPLVQSVQKTTITG